MSFAKGTRHSLCGPIWRQRRHPFAFVPSSPSLPLSLSLSIPFVSVFCPLPAACGGRGTVRCCLENYLLILSCARCDQLLIHVLWLLLFPLPLQTEHVDTCVQPVCVSLVLSIVVMEQLRYFNEMSITIAGLRKGYKYLKKASRNHCSKEVSD